MKSRGRAVVAAARRLRAHRPTLAVGVVCVALLACRADAEDGDRSGGAALARGAPEARTAMDAPGAPAPAPPGFATAAVAEGERVASQELPEGVTPAMVRRGETVFGGDGICYNCHGPEGRGIPQLGADLTDAEWIHVDGSYASLIRIIGSGVPSEASSSGMPMPPEGGGRLSEADVRALAAYVWTLSR